jgi:hypothetical protein
MLMQLIQTLIALLMQNGMSAEQAQQAVAEMTGMGGAGGAGAAGMGGAGASGGAGAAGNAGNAGNAGDAGGAAAMSPAEAAGQAMQGMAGAQALGQGFEEILRGGPNVAVIDDFSGPNSHGQQIAGQIEGQDVRTTRYNIANGGDLTANISGSLDDVLRRVASGQQVDAVNLSQQSFQATGGAQGVRDRIAQLQQMGVPVVVSAGNGGPGARNQLAGGAAFVVENSARGSESRASSSGVGNIRAEGQFTSQAAANVSVAAAKAHSQGQSLPQIQQTVTQKANQEGGSLNGR